VNRRDLLFLFSPVLQRTERCTPTIATGFNYPPEDIRAYGSVGGADDSATLTSALIASRHVIIPVGVVVRARDVAITADRQQLQIDGELIGVAGGTNVLSVEGADRASIFGQGHIDTNSLSYGIRSRGTRCTVSGLTFLGHVLNSYVCMEGDFADVIRCSVPPGYACGNIPFLFAGQHGKLIERPRFFENRLEDVRGFNVQFRFCRGAQCVNNTFVNPMYEDTKTVAGAQSVFMSIDLDVDDIDRMACQVNGVQRHIQSWAHSSGSLYTATITPAASRGDSVKFIGSRSLENIQFNTEVHGGEAIGNTCDGTGDSNIVIGTDFHDGVNTGGTGVDEDDYPRNIIIRSNILKNAMASSVNMSQVIGGTIGGNDCSGWGQRHDTNGGPFYCAIFCGAGSAIRVDPNTLHADGIRTQYGVGGWETSADTTTIDFRRDHAPKKSYGTQNFLGTFTAKYFCAVTSVATERRFDVHVDGVYADYPQILQALPMRMGGGASMKVAAKKSRQARLLANGAVTNGILKVGCWAKNSGATPGSIGIVYDNNTKHNPEPGLTMTVQSTGWEWYEISVPITAYGSNGLFLRFSGGASNATHFQYPSVKFCALSIV
jgi:hypothetical protein